MNFFSGYIFKGPWDISTTLKGVATSKRLGITISRKLRIRKPALFAHYFFRLRPSKTRAET